MSVHRLQVEGMLNYQGIPPVFSFLGQFGFLFYFGWYLAWYMTWAKRLRTRVAVPMLAAMTVLAAVVLFSLRSAAGAGRHAPGHAGDGVLRSQAQLPLKSIVIVLLIFVFVIFPVYNTFRRQVNRSLDTARRVDRTALNMARNWDSEKYLDASLFAFLKRCGDVHLGGRAWCRTQADGSTTSTGDAPAGADRTAHPPAFSGSRQAEHQHRARVRGDVRTHPAPDDRETEIAPTMVGDFYWNFAAPGVDRRDVAPREWDTGGITSDTERARVRPDPKVDLRHTVAVARLLFSRPTLRSSSPASSRPSLFSSFY